MQPERDPMTTPSVGRIVHYVSLGSAGGEYPSVCRAAIITEVDATDDTRIGLAALNPTGAFFHPLGMGGVEHVELPPRTADTGNIVSTWEDGSQSDSGVRARTQHLPGTWHWPERV